MFAVVQITWYRLSFGFDGAAAAAAAAAAADSPSFVPTDFFRRPNMTGRETACTQTGVERGHA